MTVPSGRRAMRRRSGNNSRCQPPSWTRWWCGRTQWQQVVEVGRAAVLHPCDDVMDVAVPEPHGAVGEAAAAVHRPQRPPLLDRGHAPAVAVVQHGTVAVDDERDDHRVTGDAAHRLGWDGLPVERLTHRVRMRAVGEGGGVDQHGHLGRAALLAAAWSGERGDERVGTQLVERARFGLRLGPLAATAASRTAETRASASGSRATWVWHRPVWRSVQRCRNRWRRIRSRHPSPSSADSRRARSRTWRSNQSTDDTDALSTSSAACSAELGTHRLARPGRRPGPPHRHARRRPSRQPARRAARACRRTAGHARRSCWLPVTSAARHRTRRSGRGWRRRGWRRTRRASNAPAPTGRPVRRSRPCAPGRVGAVNVVTSPTIGCGLIPRPYQTYVRLSPGSDGILGEPRAAQPVIRRSPSPPSRASSNHSGRNAGPDRERSQVSNCTAARASTCGAMRSAISARCSGWSR